jgi:hypothetical protein
MFFNTLTTVYDQLVTLGLTKSQRHFSTQFLGRGPTYLNDYVAKERGNAPVPKPVVRELRAKLTAVAALAPTRLRERLRDLVGIMDEGSRVAAILVR